MSGTPKPAKARSATRRSGKLAAKSGAQSTLRSWNEVVKPLLGAVRESERLSERDFAIRINTK